MMTLRLLFVACSPACRARVRAELRRAGYSLDGQVADDPIQLARQLDTHAFDAILVAHRPGEFPLEQTIAALKARELDIPSILLTAPGQSIGLAEVMARGAQDCLCMDDLQRLVPTLERELVYAALRFNVREQVVTDHLLAEIDQYILNKYNLREVVQRVCQRMVELFGFKLVWIGLKQDGGGVEVIAASGETAYLQEISVRWDDSAQGRGTTGTAIRENRPVVLTCDDPAFAPWRKRAERFGFQSILAMPLGLRGEVIGALMMYAADRRAFDRITVTRLSAFAARVTVAMLGAQEQQDLRLMEVAMNHASNAMFIADREGRIVWLNDALSHISGYAANEILGKTPHLFNSATHPPAFWAAMWMTILSGSPWRGEVVNRRKSGEHYTVAQSISPLLDERGQVAHFLVVQQDISEKRRLEEQIHFMAYHDALTGLPNRMLFQDRLQQEIISATRCKTQFAVMFLDLDGFKEINDGLGHSAGDRLLQTVAERLRRTVRKGDTVARLGGDEFILLLRGAKAGAGLEKLVDKLIERVAVPCDLAGQAAGVTASIGISLFPRDAHTMEELMQHADEAMYRAKQAGKNRFAYWR